MERTIEQDIQFLKDAGIERILQDKELRLLFHHTAVSVFGENCLNCDGKIRLKFNQLINHKNPNQMSKLKYRLLKDVVISMNSPNWKEDVHNSNLTNEKAEMLLNISLKFIFRFEEAPNIEKLKQLAESGVKTLNEALKSGGVKKAEMEKAPESFEDELVKIKGIGPSTAEKIVKVYPVKDVLLDALSADVPMPFLGKRESIIVELLQNNYQ